MKRAFLFLICLLFSRFFSVSQEVYTHISDENIYDFLDEMAGMKLIQINSCIKPYSRLFIAGCLEKVAGDSSKLNIRQKKELDFYLKDYNLELKKSLNYFNSKTNIFHKNPLFATSINPIGFYYKDSLSSISIRPLLGIRVYNNGNGYIQHRWSGAEAFANIGKHWAMYANFRDNRISQDLVAKTYLVDMTGIDNKNGPDFSEMRGGLVYSWDWGSFGLIKDHVEWGNNYHGSNILSGRTPSFAMLKLNIRPAKWLDFNYIHGWLNSEIVDSLRSNLIISSGPRYVYYEKYIAANMYTIRLGKSLDFSIGNSIVYSSYTPNPYFMIPFLFFKSLDHTLYVSSNAGQNSQVFLDISSRQIRYTHIYASLFVDEFSFSNMRDKANQSNWVGGKFGFHISRIFTGNLSFTTEITVTAPMVYKHYVPTTTFESNGYSLGSYLGDNAFELYMKLKFKPFKCLHFELSMMDKKKGPDYKDDRSNGHVAGGYPYMESVIWENKTLDLKVEYEIVNNTYLYFEFANSNVSSKGYFNKFDNVNVTAEEVLKKYTPEYLWGNTGTIICGMNIGF